MKIPRKQLELRPLRPAFLDIIPRLPAMVSKNEILFQIFSPITYVFRSIKNMFKKRASLQKIQQARKFQTRTKKNTRGSHDEEVENNEKEEKVYDRGDYSNKRGNGNINHSDVEEWFRRARTSGQGGCLSCREDRPAYQTCSMCQGLNSSFPPSSCLKCQKRGPVVFLCLRYHNRQPVIYLPEDGNNTSLCDEFSKRRVMLRQVAKVCNGKHSTINNCPMCSSIWPTMGECNCRDCKNTKPIVKFYTPRSSNKARVYVCPCSECAHLHPKIKICDTCRIHNDNNVKKDMSLYVMFPRSKRFSAL